MPSRYIKWLHASQAVRTVNPILVTVVRGLGLLDRDLIDKDEKLFQDLIGKDKSQPSTELLSHYTLSFLWVFGAYELVRTVVEAIGRQKLKLPKGIPQRLTELRDKRLGRLRMPLAKVQASGQFQTDSAIPPASLRKNKGTTWEVNSGVAISRKEVSDELLSILSDWETASKAALKKTP